MGENMKIVVWVEKNLSNIDRAFVRNSRKIAQNSSKIRTLGCVCALGFGFSVSGIINMQAEIGDLSQRLDQLESKNEGESDNEEAN